MNSRIGLLAALLFVQLVLVGVAFFAGGRDDAGDTFLDLDPTAVTGLRISGDDEEGVVLTRAEEGWRVAELPADADKITDVIDKLTGGIASWPVATSEDSRIRFEVTAEKHQRRIDLEGEDGVLATVYLGTSPGYRRVHARRDGDDEIYSIDFAVHELPAGTDDWLDTRLLASTGIRRVELPEGRVLAQAADDTGWTLDGAVTDPEATRQYLERLERLAVLGRYEPDESAALGEAKVVRVDAAEGVQRLTFRFNETADEYVLSSDRYPGEFTVASYVAEQILADPADLLPQPEASDPAAAEGEDAGDAGDVIDAAEADAGV